MEMDFWGSRAHSAKHHHFHTLQSGRFNNSDNHLTMEGDDDDVRAWFPCPFCYFEIEIPILCYHLQEEHCLDLKNAVCPICAANLGKDALAHFTSHHVHSIKRRRKSQKSGLSSNGPSHTRDIPDTHETTPDPLSAFLRNVPFSDVQQEQVPNATSQVKSTNEEEEEEAQDHEEKMNRAEFVQELVFSTIF